MLILTSSHFLALGMSQSKSYEDEQFVWTPANNPSIKNYEKSKVMFAKDQESRLISVIIESKEGNLLTR